VSDVERLVALMGEFYAEAGYAFDTPRATETFAQLLRDERLGRVWLIEDRGVVAGYMVVTLGFSMEYGGLDAFLDDLYIRPAHRGAGLGSRAVAEARDFCARRGVRALHLEAEQGNATALGLYRRAGFEGNHRQLLTLRLPPPPSQ
jgi:ribosomal protein S18 acetylase RimI-like enzyme